MRQIIEYVGGVSYGATHANRGCIDVRVRINHEDPARIELCIIQAIRELNERLMKE